MGDRESVRPPRDSPPSQQRPAESAPSVQLGIPVPRGTPLSVSAHLDSEDAILAGVQSDDYSFIRHLLLQGYITNQFSTCSFFVSKASGASANTWIADEATLLHYAIGTGKLRAAVALLLISPKDIESSCVFRTLRDQQALRPLDLAVALARWHKEDSFLFEQFSQAAFLLVLPEELPYMHLETARERLLAAGENPSSVLDAACNSLGMRMRASSAMSLLMNFYDTHFQDLETASLI